MVAKKSPSYFIVLHLVAIFLVILNVSDIQIDNLPRLMPLLDLMAVFYFAVFKNIFGIWFVFLLGIWGDALNGDPLGATSLCYILLVKFFLLLNSKMLTKENFRQIWQQFVSFCCLFLLIKWVILSIFNGVFYSPVAPLIQLVLSSSLYAVVHKLFDYLNNKLLE